jgi:hypothetical protein
MPGQLRPNGDLWTDHVSGKMTSGERETRLNRLRAVTGTERGVLTNARCLSEGVDVPTLDGVAFIDPRRSQVDVVQAVGRAIRKARDKTIGTITIPVFVDDGADPVDALDSSEFDRVWQVVRALRDHDDVLAEELDQAARELGRRGSVGKKPANIVLDLPSAVGIDFARAFDTKVVEKTTENWEFMFGLLSGFIRREGHARVPRTQEENGFQLGTWVKNQRRDYRYRRLPRARVEELEALLGWAWNARHENWNDALAALLKYSLREGHSEVPFLHIEEGLALGRWRSNQQLAYWQKRLSAERIEALERVVGWTWRFKEPTVRHGWEVGYQRLQEYVTREGDANVKANHVEQGFKLGAWVNRQRTQFKTHRLIHDRAARLESIDGWVWNVLDANWDKGFAALESFVRRERHARVPGAHVESGFLLGAWVSKQRAAFAAGNLSADRQMRLEGLPGWSWRVAKPQRRLGWDHVFGILEQYATREHDTRVPVNHHEDGFALGKWVAKQRAMYRDERLSDERRERLEVLPNWTWQGKTQMWEDSLELLARFVEREGSAKVPSGHVESGMRLDRWIRKQRSAHRRGQLSATRVARLDPLPGWVWDAEKKT